MSNAKALSAARLRADPALGEIVRDIGLSLQTEIITHGPMAPRGHEAWLEYHALQRIVAMIDQMAQPVLKETEDNG